MLLQANDHKNHHVDYQGEIHKATHIQGLVDFHEISPCRRDVSTLQRFARFNEVYATSRGQEIGVGTRMGNSVGKYQPWTHRPALDYLLFSALEYNHARFLAELKAGSVPLLGTCQLQRTVFGLR